MVRDYPIRHAEADGQHERFGTPNGSRPQVGQLACWPVPPPHSPPGQAGRGGPQADAAQGCRRAGHAERPRPGRATPRTLRAPVAPTSQRSAAGPSARTTSPGVLRSCDRLRADSGWFGSWHTTGSRPSPCRLSRPEPPCFAPCNALASGCHFEQCCVWLASRRGHSTGSGGGPRIGGKLIGARASRAVSHRPSAAGVPTTGRPPSANTDKTMSSST